MLFLIVTLSHPPLSIIPNTLDDAVSLMKLKLVIVKCFTPFNAKKYAPPPWLIVFPFPFIVKVFAAEEPGILGKSVLTMYGPDPATTSTNVAAESPQFKAVEKKSPKELKLVPAVGEPASIV